MKKILLVYNSSAWGSAGFRLKYISEYLEQRYIVDKCPIYSNIELKRTISNPKFAWFIVNRLFQKIFYAPQSNHYNIKTFKKEIKEKIINGNHDTVIIFVRPFYLLRLTSIIRAINQNIRIIVDMTDPFYLNVALKHLSLLKKAQIKMFERKYLRNIDALIVLNEELREYYNKITKGKTKVIEQGISKEEVPLNIKSLTSSDKSTIRLIYGGTLIENIREPYELIKAVAQFDKDIKLDLYAKYVRLDKSKLTEKENINYNSLIDKNELINIFLKSDIVVFIDNFYGKQVPGKILETLAIPKPILFIYNNENSPTLRYIDNQPGVYLAYNNINSITNAIHQILNNGIQEYNRTISKYYWDSLLIKLNELLK